MNESIIKEFLAEFGSKRELYSEFTTKLHSLISALLDEQGIRVHSVTCRLKELGSLSRKLSKPGSSYANLSDVTDIAGIRITTFFSDEVDQVALLLENEFIVDWSNSIDKRSALDPDRFGYLSLHHVLSLPHQRSGLTEYRRFTNLKVEVQTRSILQHAWAEIEHDLGYKTASGVPNEIRRRFSRLAGLLELADQEFVAIRDSLAAYEDTVAEKIEKVPELVEINKASLESFVKTNAVVARLDQVIAGLGGGTLEEESPDYIELQVARLTALGFKSIAELEQSLVKHEAVIIAFAKVWLIDAKRDLQFAQGVCLLYFGYVLLAQTGDKALAKQHFDTFSIGLSDKTAELAERLMGTQNFLATGTPNSEKT